MNLQLMINSKVVIQKLCPDRGVVELHQNFDLRSSWTFETHRKVSRDDAIPEIFPFVFHGSTGFSKGLAGSETKMHKMDESTLLFSDEYGVPEGFLIGVLFPAGFMPSVFKFRQSPMIPVGAGSMKASMQPPGHFDLYVNKYEKTAALVFHITETTLFGVKCIATKTDAGFDGKDKYPFYEEFFPLADFSVSHPIEVTADDLRQYKDYLKSEADESELADLINSLINNSEEPTSTLQRSSAMEKIESLLSNTSAITGLVDSYRSGGAVAGAIAKVIAYASL